MQKGIHHKFFIVTCVLSLFIVLVMPVLAANGTISIGYRGAGGNYLGDTIVFDGENTFGNETYMKMTGPGLPAEGIPVYDTNGVPGTGNPVPMNPDGSWKFVWYTGSIRGTEKISTARYYITVWDGEMPDKTATTSILIKKPEFEIHVVPGTVTRGEYIQLTGHAEKDVMEVHFAISNAAGELVQTYDTTVSSSGYFNKGIHVDMPPGIYTITMSSPSVRSTSKTILTINATSEGSTGIPVTSSPAVPDPAASPAGSGSLLVTSTPSGATVFINTIMVGNTPYSADNLQPGTYLVEVKAPGFTTASMNVQVTRGETTTIGPVLVKGSGSAPVSEATLCAGVIISCTLFALIRRRKEV